VIFAMSKAQEALKHRTKAPIKPRRSKSLRYSQGKLAAIFLLPYMLIFIVFRLGPSIAGVFISFCKWDLAGSLSFVWLDNFIRLATDRYFHISLLNTLYFFLLTLPPLVILSLLLAILLNQKMRFKSVGRVISIVPYVLIPAVVGIIWNWMYDNNFGILNFYIKKIGGDQVQWLTSDTMALISVAIVVVWSFIGYNMILFLAGLQGIPRELYEASTIDGSSRVQTFFNITLPMLAPISSMVLTLTLINTVQLFDQIFVMTNGGPGTRTLTMVQYLYTSAFQNFEMGYGSAIEVVVLIILVILIKLQNTFMKVDEGV
jgi:multiple sugar transport system permease protein